MSALAVLERIPAMFFHFLHLLGHAWYAFKTALGTTTLGFVAPLLVSLVSIVATLYYILQKRGKDAMLKHWKEDAVIALRVIVVVTFLIYGPILFFVGLVKTVYDDHERLVTRNKKLAELNQDLSKEVKWRKHNISTNDAVFSNIIYLLQAFHSYRNAQRGQPCVIWFTAAPDSLPLARTVAQFSNSVSGCFTFGPFPAGNPDLDEEVLDGSVSGAIVLHTSRNDAAANQLETLLGNQIQVRRSFTPIRTPKARLYTSLHQYTENFIWLQFGPNVKWNSELFLNEPHK